MKVYNTVEAEMAMNAENRNSDRKLILNVWEKQLGRKFPQEIREFIINDSMSTSSIIRCRAKIQSEGRYPASKEIQDFRFQNFVDAKYTAGQALPW